MSTDYIIGRFVREGGRGCFADLRGGEGERLEDPLADDRANLAKTVEYAGDALQENEYYQFDWHIEGEDRDFRIVCDGNVKPVDRVGLLNRMMESAFSLKGRNRKQFENFQKTLMDEVTGAPHTYIYELLQNANDYPYQGQPVKVRFVLTEHYLFFLHSGAPFNLQNIVAISAANEGEKRENTETIGYKGIGFKSVFVKNNYVYLRSGGWSLRFDEEEIKRRRSQKQAWTLIPIATYESEVDDEVKQVLSQLPADIRVQFALRHKENAASNLPNLDRVFSDNQILVFIPNVSEADVVVGGKSRYHVTKDLEHWAIIDDKVDVTPELKNNIEELLRRQERVPEKLKSIKKIKISLAITREQGRLLPIKDAKVYNYLPTEDSIGLKFLVNADFIPSGDRAHLHPTEWNYYVMRQCGVLFAKWWASFMEREGEYDLKSVFDILPDLDLNQEYAKLFVDGFISTIKEIKCIPTLRNNIYELRRLDEIIIDTTRLVASDAPVITDEEFYTCFAPDEALPHPSIRRHDGLLALCRKCSRSRTFADGDIDNLIEALCDSNHPFARLMRGREHNVRFLDYLLKEGRMRNDVLKCIFLSSDGQLAFANQIHYNIDEMVEDIYMFSELLPRLDTHIRQHLDESELWKGYESKFKAFSPVKFAKEISDGFTDKGYSAALQTKENGIHYIHFLAKYASDERFPAKLQFFTEDDRSVTSKALYQKNDLGAALMGHNWVGTDWIRFLSEEYFAKEGKLVSGYLAKHGVGQLHQSTVLNAIVNDDTYKELAKALADKDDNVDFFRYLHSLCYDGYTVRFNSLPEKIREAIPVYTGDGQTDSADASTYLYYLRSKELDKFRANEWLPASATWAISDFYFDGLSDKGKKSFEKFFNDINVSNDFSIKHFFEHLISDCWDQITENITTKELSYSLLNFLFENRECIGGNLSAEQLLAIPIPWRDETELLPIGETGEDEVTYQCSDSIDELSAQSWFESSELTVADDFLVNLFSGKERTAFFRGLGFEVFDFKQYLEDVLIPDLQSGYYAKALSNLDSNRAFHEFFALHSKQYGLSEKLLETLKDQPIFITRPGGEDTDAELVGISTGHVLPTEALNEIVKEDIIPLAVLKAIHPSYFAENSDLMTKYLLQLGNAKMEDSAIFGHLRNNKAAIESYIKQPERNIRFWAWASNAARTIDDLRNLKGLPLMDCNEEFFNPTQLYISDEYSADDFTQKVIDSFVMEEHHYVSPLYLLPDIDVSNGTADGEAIERWVRLFKAIGVNVSPYNILTKQVLPRLNQYEDDLLVIALAKILPEIEDQPAAEREKIHKQLGQLKLKCNDNRYRLLPNTVITGRFVGFECNNYPDVVLGDHVSEEYLTGIKDNPSLRNKVQKFFNYLLDNCNAHSIKTREELAKQKALYFVKNQERFLSEEVHYRIIDELAEDYAQNSKKVPVNLSQSGFILYDHLGKPVKIDGKTLVYLGSVFNPNCDYQGHGVTSLHFVNDAYARGGIAKACKFFKYLGVKYDFSGQRYELDLLAKREFAYYFWNTYLPERRNDTFFCNSVLKEENFRTRKCIPTADGDVKRPYELYSIEGDNEDLRAIIEALGKEDTCLPDVVLPPKYPLGLLTELNVRDCLEYLLLNEESLSKYRMVVYKWLANKEASELKQYAREIQLFREHALWKAGDKKWYPLKDLLVLEWSGTSRLLKDHFGSSRYVCALMPETEIAYKAICNIMGKRPLVRDDFDKKSEDGHPDLKAIKEIGKRLLYLSFIQDEKNWKELYESRQRQLAKTNILSCKGIRYFYDDNLSTELQTFTDCKDELWYVGEWPSIWFSRILDWVVDAFNLKDFDKPFIETLFATPFNEFLKKQGELSADFIAMLSEEDKEGLVEEAEEPTGQPHARRENPWNQPMPDHKADPDYGQDEPEDDSECDNGNEEEQDSATRPDGNKAPEHGDNKHKASPVGDTKPDGKQKGHTTPSSDLPKSPTKPSPSNKETGSDYDDDDEASFEKRSHDKWDAEARKSTAPPTSSQPTHVPDGETFNPDEKPKTEPTRGAMFDDEPSRPKPKERPTKPENNDSRDIERAKDEIRRAKDKRSMLRSLGSYPEYSVEWFNYRIDIINEDIKTTFGSKDFVIDFWNWQLIDSDKGIYRLVSPSRLIPHTLADYTQQTVCFKDIAGERFLVSARIVEADDSGIDLMYDKAIPSPGSERCIRIKAKTMGGFTECQTSRFRKLSKNYPNPLALLSLELPKNISFIYGPPGTGKTRELVERIAKYVTSNRSVKILVLTPTNRAADEIAERLCMRRDTKQYVSRYGITESRYLVNNHFDVLRNRTDMVLSAGASDVVITTIARYPYDSINKGTPIFDVKWDHIIVDEASMIDIIPMTLLLLNNKAKQFTIAGDPMQIKPVTPHDIEERNIYDMVGLRSFRDAKGQKCKYHVDVLETQHRSVSTIGTMVSKFAYDGLLLNDHTRYPQKPLSLPGIKISTTNTVGYHVDEMGMLYGFNPVEKSSVHIYSAIFAYEFAGYMARAIGNQYPDQEYSIGIVSPYGKQADAIKQLLEANNINQPNCTVKCGTVHKFQGGECDIMIVVMNYPSTNSKWEVNVNKVNIMNVAMSRAKDYVFFLMPMVYSAESRYLMNNELGKILPTSNKKLYAYELEEIIFGQKNYISTNASLTCHLPVNVSSGSNKRYEIRLSDTALDIQLNTEI